MDQRALARRRLNRAVLNRASVQVNTFPSGHASTAAAAALPAFRRRMAAPSGTPHRRAAPLTGGAGPRGLRGVSAM